MIDERRFGGRQGRLLFAYLVLEQGRPVPHHELADILWGEALPPTWERALRVLVSKLRALLAEHGVDGASALTGAFGCYRLNLLGKVWVDVIAAGDAVAEAETALAAGNADHGKAAASLAESVARQLLLPGEEGEWVEQKRRELADVRYRAVGVLADACLRSGAPVEGAAWAEQAIALEPFRETGYRRLMEAQAAAGNRAEALRVYERCRQLLAEELGAYPSPETESVYRRLLEAPSSPNTVHVSKPASRRASRASPKRLGLFAATALATGAIVAGIAAKGSTTHEPVAVNSVVAVDQSGSVAAVVPVGVRPVALTSAAGSLWVANLDDHTVSRIDATSRHVLRTIPIGAPPTALAAARHDVWVADGSGNVAKIDPTYNRATVSSRLAAAGSGFFGAFALRPTLAAFGFLWVVNPDGYVSRVDPGSGRVEGTVDVGNIPSAIAAGAGSIWVTNSADGTVTRIDPTLLLATTIPVGHGPSAIAVNAAGAWITDASDNSLVQLDLETNAVVGRTPVGVAPVAVLATPTALWVANAGDGTVLRLDPRTGTPHRTIHLGGTPNALAAAAGQVWVTVAPAPPPRPLAGGVARLSSLGLSALDPALVGADGRILYATCANLLTYPDEAGPKGLRIVPEVAESVPTPTDGGRRYTFRIRRGFRFSPPSNEAVTAATFKSTIERVTDPRLKSPIASFFKSIVGYHAYVTGRARALRGLVVRGETLTVRLSRPGGVLLSTLAAGGACAVPRGTPAVADGIDDIPSAGPYYIASYTPRQQLVLKRNPNYHGTRPRRLDEIVLTLGVDPLDALKEVEAGTADYAFDGVPGDSGPTLAVRYGPASKAAKAGRQQYFTNPVLGGLWLHMNTARPLFSKLRLRRAVNYAVDRRALVAQGRRFAELNPWNAGAPTADYLPPSIEGAANFHLYPLDGPDLGRAKRIAGHVRATAIMYAPNVRPWSAEAQIIRRDLRALGIHVQVRTFPVGEYFGRIARRGEPFDLAVVGWAFGNDPEFVLSTFGGSKVLRYGAANISSLENPTFDRRLKAAERLSGRQRYRAFRRLARWLEWDVAPAAAIATNASRDFFAARIGCEFYQPVYGIDLGALCVRR